MGVDHTLATCSNWKTDCIKSHGRVLTGAKAHWCPEWDGLPVDETTPEFDCCICKLETPTVIFSNG